MITIRKISKLPPADAECIISIKRLIRHETVETYKNYNTPEVYSILAYDEEGRCYELEKECSLSRVLEMKETLDRIDSEEDTIVDIVCQ